MAQKTLGGIYPPLPTFFDEQENLDLATLQHHIQHLANTGIAGYVLMGSNGESIHLNPDERQLMIATTRQTVGPHAQILAGCGEQSTRATITLCHQAAQSGADFALVLPPFYFKGSMNNAALLNHYRTVADHSPIPVVIYNMPANTAGLDIDAATIIALAEHPNIVGLKDSSGNMAKMAYVIGVVPQTFRVFAGSAGYLLPALSVGAAGAVAALANIFPREVCRVQELFNAGQLAEARLLQARLTPANTAITTTYNVPGLKAALEITHGYGGAPRSPLLPLNTQERDTLAQILKLV